ncbi:MAG: hypothetical protein J0H68_01485 [Sphingobacteriia bacterium]|nr:hypothetical protein [Sphingobacteriia bacterium]
MSKEKTTELLDLLPEIKAYILKKFSIINFKTLVILRSISKEMTQFFDAHVLPSIFIQVAFYPTKDWANFLAYCKLNNLNHNICHLDLTLTDPIEFSVLSNTFPNLESLFYSTNNFALTDINELGKFTKLKNLTLKADNFTDLKFLSSLTNLESLCIHRGFPIDNWYKLTCLTKLKQLDILVPLPHETTREYKDLVMILTKMVITQELDLHAQKSLMEDVMKKVKELDCLPYNSKRNSVEKSGVLNLNEKER